MTRLARPNVTRKARSIGVAAGGRVVTIDATPQGSNVELFVRDTGPGLTPEVEKRVMLPVG